MKSNTNSTAKSIATTGKMKIPEIMKAILVKELGAPIDEVITETNDKSIPERGKGQLLVRVLACSLAPGDIRVQSGQCDFYQKPKEIPYVPGGDLCGIVVDVDEDDERFKIGDIIAAMFTLPGPTGGLAEYAIVQSCNAEIKPKSVTPVEAACLPSSALTAMLAVERYVKKGDRVLVLGGAGGVGTAFVQLAKQAGSSFTAATSTQEKLLCSIGVDRVVDYRKGNWWEIPDFQEEKFHLIFDLVGGNSSWIKSSSVLCNGGLFLAAAGDTPFPEIHNWFDIGKMMTGYVWRTLYSKYWPFSPPCYKFHSGLDITPGVWKRLYQHVDDGNLKVIVDQTYDFKAEQVREAFHYQASRHVHGKIAVKISEE